MIQDYIDNFIWQSSRITAKKFFENEGIGYKKLFEESSKFYDYISKNNEDYNGVLSKLNHNNSTILLFLAFRSIKKVEDVNNLCSFLFKLYDKVKNHKGQLTIFTARIVNDNKNVKKLFFYFCLEYVSLKMYLISGNKSTNFNEIKNKNYFSNNGLISTDFLSKFDIGNFIKYESEKNFYEVIDSIEEELNVSF